MNKLLSKCNALVCNDEKEIPFDEAKNPAASVYMGVDCKLPRSPTMPVAMRPKLIEAHCLQERCTEELALLEAEVDRLRVFFLSQIAIVDDVLVSTNDRGICSLLKVKRILLAHALHQLRTTLSQWFPETDFSDCPYFQTFHLSTDETCIYPRNTASDDNPALSSIYDCVDDDDVCDGVDDDDDDGHCDSYDESDDEYEGDY